MAWDVSLKYYCSVSRVHNALGYVIQIIIASISVALNGLGCVIEMLLQC